MRPSSCQAIHGPGRDPVEVVARDLDPADLRRSGAGGPSRRTRRRGPGRRSRCPAPGDRPPSAARSHASRPSAQPVQVDGERARRAEHDGEGVHGRVGHRQRAVLERDDVQRDVAAPASSSREVPAGPSPAAGRRRRAPRPSARPHPVRDGCPRARRAGAGAVACPRDDCAGGSQLGAADPCDPRRRAARPDDGRARRADLPDDLVRLRGRRGRRGPVRPAEVRQHLHAPEQPHGRRASRSASPASRAGSARSRRAAGRRRRRCCSRRWPTRATTSSPARRSTAGPTRCST